MVIAPNALNPSVLESKLFDFVFLGFNAPNAQSELNALRTGCTHQGLNASNALEMKKLSALGALNPK